MIPTVVIVLGMLFFIAVGWIAQFCFDDNDPDMNWHDNYSVIECPHNEKTDVIVHSTVTLEEIWTICDDCCEVLNKRIES